MCAAGTAGTTYLVPGTRCPLGGLNLTWKETNAVDVVVFTLLPNAIAGYPYRGAQLPRAIPGSSPFPSAAT